MINLLLGTYLFYRNRIPLDSQRRSYRQADTGLHTASAATCTVGEAVPTAGYALPQ